MQASHFIDFLEGEMAASGGKLVESIHESTGRCYQRAKKIGDPSRRMMEIFLDYRAVTVGDLAAQDGEDAFVHLILRAGHGNAIILKKYEKLEMPKMCSHLVFTPDLLVRLSGI